jgi:hypothetical protein
VVRVSVSLAEPAYVEGERADCEKRSPNSECFKQREDKRFGIGLRGTAETAKHAPKTLEWRKAESKHKWKRTGLEEDSAGT